MIGEIIFFHRQYVQLRLLASVEDDGRRHLTNLSKSRHDETCYDLLEHVNTSLNIKKKSGIKS